MAIIEREPSSLSKLARQNEPVGLGNGEAAVDDAKKDAAEQLPPAPGSQPQPRPSLVPLGSNHSSVSTTTTTKKFSAVNIGKKFLEKNAQAASSSSSSAASAHKTSAATVRPTVQASQTQSRLVTAKLTAAPFATSPAGWSRPSSVAPASTPGNNSAATTPPLPNSKSSSPGPPKSGQLKDSGKPVWGNVKPSARPDIRQDDFPTAAEVAKAAVKVKPEDTKSDPEALKPSPSRVEDADTFRGVHLDPNAHHWDEMEEDDDDFLGGVVEFGDGRQYKVEAVDETETKEDPNQGHDRFADDFDRSWPKTSPSPSIREIPAPIPVAHEASRSPVFSTTGLHSSSPRDSPRALFNERSNRLEPYNHGRPPGPGSGRPNDFGAQNVRVLHKPPGLDSAPLRNRRFSGASAGSSSAILPSPRDNQFSRRDGAPPSPRMPRDLGHPMGPSRSFGGRERENRGSMGPPPIPAHALKAAQASGRPLPPHLAPPAEAHPPSRPILSTVNTKTASIPSQSPRNGPVPLSAVSATDAASPMILNGVDVDDARKELMQTAAARAKQRRQQEEAEREAQKERARRKALEIEEKMKAEALEKAKREEALKAPPTAPQADLVNSIIEDAVKSAQPPSPIISRPPGEAAKTPHQDGGPANVSPRRPSAFAQKVVIPPAQQPSSWRANAKPRSPVVPVAPPPTQSMPVRRASSGFVASTTVALDAAVDGVKEDLEIVDFADMAKLVNGSSPEILQSPKEGPAPNSRPARPVASDFFEDTPRTADTTKQEDNAWRRKSPALVQDPPPETDKANDLPRPSLPPTALSQPPTLSPTLATIPSQPEVTVAKPESIAVPPATKEPLPHLEPSTGRYPPNIPAQPASPRTPRSQTFYKDANISSLDDTMSRIKGAMRKASGGAKDVPRPEVPMAPPRPTLKSSTRERWVPPALRPRSVGFVDEENHEVFSVTAEEPPHSPTMTPSFRLPTVSKLRDPIPKYQLKAFQKFPQPARFELLSFVPPVEGMNKRDFSVNSVLFKKPVYFKGKYRVSIPRHRGSRPQHLGPPGVGKLQGPGPFSKPTIADGATSWRKPASIQPQTSSSTDVAESTVDTELKTMSRSPPPDIPPSEPQDGAKVPKIASPKSDARPVIRSRPQPKMPAGSVVAFRRDSRIDVVDDSLKTSVNFIVSDELDESSGKAQDPGPPESESIVPLVSAPTNASLPQAASQSLESSSTLPSDLSLKSDSLFVGNSVEKSTPHQQSPWARASVTIPLKESTSRGPDPEHLKALWSQPSGKSEQLHSVNSLEGITDDLSSLPFTFPNVKSEDGTTPPPNAPQPTSRMSQHEVTRAFQQVPQPTTLTTIPPRPAISPPSTNAPVARPTTASTTTSTGLPANPGYSYSPMSQHNVRLYGSYPSPLMSHSPGPGIMYPHPMAGSPVPSRIPVTPHTPLYGQSMWVPIPGQAPPNPNMRPSPYPQQMMTYGTQPAGGPNPYSPQGPPPPPPPPHNMHVSQHQPMQNGVQGNRNRNPAVSPIMTHAPMYPGSPLLVHPSVLPNQNHGYAMSNGRGQPRADGSNLNGPQSHHPSSQQPHLMYPQNPHARNTPQPFPRAAW